MGESQQIAGARFPPSVGRQKEGLEKPDRRVEGQEGRAASVGGPVGTTREPHAFDREQPLLVGGCQRQSDKCSSQMQKQSARCWRACCRPCDPRGLHWLFQEQT